MDAAGAKWILIVEDDDEIRETLAEILEDESFRVLQAGHGRAALALIQGGMLPDLLLIDLMMPVMTGWQLLEALDRDERLRQIPVVVFSAAHDAGTMRGAREVLRKPLNLEHLLHTIQKHVA